MVKIQPQFSFFFLAGSLSLALALPVTAQTQPCPGTGEGNTCYGSSALNSNTTGYVNTANGQAALLSNTTGFRNTATGFAALIRNTTGSNNTANGTSALNFNSTGNDNTANGLFALNSNTTGNYNTANGSWALPFNITGSNNTALGYQAGFNLTTSSNNVDIANKGVTGDNGVIRIGTVGTQTSAFIAGLGAKVTGAALYVNSAGQVGIKTSSKRFKTDIHPLGKTSEKILNLRPVTFRYKEQDEHGQHPLEYGLIAEEVAKVYPELVQYDKDGKPFTVYYDALTPLLLGEVQKEHKAIASLKAENLKQQAENQALKAALKQQGIQLAALKQAQAQQLQMLSKLAMLRQAKAKVQPQKAIYRP